MVLYRRLGSQFKEALWTGVLFLPALCLWLLYRACAASVRGRVVNPVRLPARRCVGGQNAIYVFWHSKTFMIPFYAQSSPMACLTLRDWKNRLFDRICRLYRIRTVPVRSVSAATLELAHLLRKGFHVALALDGPRGPAGVIRPGALYLARVSGRPIICVNVRLERSFRIRRRWDRLEVPRPWTPGTGTLSEPIYVTDENGEEVRRRILAALPDR